MEDIFLFISINKKHNIFTIAFFVTISNLVAPLPTWGEAIMEQGPSSRNISFVEWGTLSMTPAARRLGKGPPCRYKLLSGHCEKHEHNCVYLTEALCCNSGFCLNSFSEVIAILSFGLFFLCKGTDSR